MRLALVLFFYFSFLVSGNSQDIKFKKLFGSFSFDFGYSVKQTSDNGYIFHIGKNNYIATLEE